MENITELPPSEPAVKMVALAKLCSVPTETFRSQCLRGTMPGAFRKLEFPAHNAPWYVPEVWARHIALIKRGTDAGLSELVEDVVPGYRPPYKEQ